MLNARRWLAASLCLLLACGCAFAQSSQVPSSPPPKESTQTEPGFSRRDLARLRPVVLRDLRGLLRRVDNENPSGADVEDAFQRCQFTPLRLGTLGPAVLVEAEAGHGKTNAAMLNIYVSSYGSYRRIIEAAGFGPMIIRGPGSVPNLVFGWASGVCHTKYYRYRYERGKYAVDACYQEDRGANWDGGSCMVKSCEGNLATFPNPWESPSEPADAGANSGPCRASAALSPTNVTADSSLPPPGDQVQFMLAASATGSCPKAPEVSGSWTTSDPANTAVSKRGLVTCLHATPTPATISYSGTFRAQTYSPATLTCK
jgi:hypothetical protein